MGLQTVWKGSNSSSSNLRGCEAKAPERFLLAIHDAYDSRGDTYFEDKWRYHFAGTPT